jgi:WD40 repeat protein
VDKTVRLWDVETGKQLALFEGHTHRVMIVAFSPDGKSIASASSDKTARLWNIKTGKAKVLEGHTGGLEAVAFSPDGKLLASSGQDGTVRIWEVPSAKPEGVAESGKVLHVLKGHEGEIDSVCFAPDGKTVASGCKDKSVKLWDPHKGELRKTLTGPETRLESLTFSPDGATLASGSGGPEATVWLWPVRAK